MTEISIFYLIKAKKGFIALATLIFVLVGLALTLSQPLKYTSSLNLLVVQNASTNTDSYTLSKSTEYLGQLLSKVAYSNLFFGKVLVSDSSLDNNYFGVSAKDRMKKWSKSVQVKSVRETGIISIEAYHTDQTQAEKLARAVAVTLMTQHTNYHGQGDNVAIRLLDEPITSTYPDKPNLLVNLLMSLLVGLVFSFAYVYLKYSSYDLVVPQYSTENDGSGALSNQEVYQQSLVSDEVVAVHPQPEPQANAGFPWQNHHIN